MYPYNFFFMFRVFNKIILTSDRFDYKLKPERNFIKKKMELKTFHKWYKKMIILGTDECVDCHGDFITKNSVNTFEKILVHNYAHRKFLRII